MADTQPSPAGAAPLLTVLIPTRNRWSLLAAQAKSVDLVLRERHVDFEIVVHDNSTDPAPHGLIDNLPAGLVYVKSPENFDTAEENICEALRHCRGDYIWLLADDDGVEPRGVDDLLDVLRRGEDDIIVFNSRHGRDERLGGHGAYITERARRFFYEKEMRCSISTFVERTGFFYWLCAISTVVVKREIASPELLRKYIGIARIYAHVAWLIEIGKNRQFLFVNRPLVVYGLLPTDHDGGRHWRSVGVREGGYSNSVWTGLWLRALDELVAQNALTLEQIRRTTDMNHATRFHFGSNLAHQVLEQLGEMPELAPAEDLRLMSTWLLRLFPGAIFLTALIDEIVAFSTQHRGSLLRVAQDSRFEQAVRARAGDLRKRAAWWRAAIGETAWYARFYVETLHLYDVYDLGSEWVAGHVGFGGFREALEVIDLPSVSDAFLRAPSYEALRNEIEAQPLDADALKRLRGATVALPGEWGRLAPETAGAMHMHVSPTAVVAPPAAPPSDEVPRLRAELARQDAQMAQVYASTSWRLTAGLRRVVTWLRPPQPVGATADPPPFLEPGRRLEFSGPEAEPYLARGFSFSEEWGRWTDGPVAVFRCRRPATETPGVFEVWTHMVWDGRGSRSCRVDAVVNGGRPVRLTLSAGEVFRVPVSARAMSAPALELALHVLAPKAAHEEPVDDGRSLGAALAAIRFLEHSGQRRA